MKGEKKDMAKAFEATPEESKVDARELRDEELKDVTGGVDILDRVKLPSTDKLLIEAPIVNPF